MAKGVLRQTKGSWWEQGEKRCIISQGYKEKSEIIKDVFELYTYTYTHTHTERERERERETYSGREEYSRQKKQLEQRHGDRYEFTVGNRKEACVRGSQ